MVVGLRIRKIKDFKGIEVVFFSRRKTGKCLEYTLFIKTDSVKLKICIHFSVKQNEHNTVN